MPGNTRKQPHRKYKKQCFGKSVFDNSPTLIINHYIVPKPYLKAVSEVITAYRSGISFNKAVDMVSSLDSDHINRNKLAEHTLKSIANDY